VRVLLKENATTREISSTFWVRALTTISFCICSLITVLQFFKPRKNRKTELLLQEDAAVFLLT
jgi:TRAP-type C4-dicarboxylate transport system permease small subunit